MTPSPSFGGIYQLFRSRCQGGMAKLQDMGVGGAQPEEVQ